VLKLRNLFYIKQNHTDTPRYSALIQLCYQLVWRDSDKGRNTTRLPAWTRQPTALIMQ